MIKALCGVSVLAVLCAACASVPGIKDQPVTAGKSRTYQASVEAVEKAARAAMVESGLAVEETYRTGDGALVIIGKAGMSAFGWGGLVRVIVQDGTNGQVVVRVLSKRKLATNVAAKGDHSESVFSGIAVHLDAR